MKSLSHSLRIFLVAFSLTSMHPASAEVFEGRILKKSYDGQRNEITTRRKDWTFQVINSGRDYSIRLKTPAVDESQYDLAYINGDLFTLRTRNATSTTSASVSSSQFPDCGEEAVEILWLAFCSGDYFATHQKIQLPFGALSPNGFESNSEALVEGKLGPANQPVPGTVRVYASPSEPKLSPPYQNGFLFLKYSVSSSNTFENIAWPQTFAIQHSIYKPDASSKDDVRVFSETIGFVDRCTNGAVVTLPEIRERHVMTFDTRFRKDRKPSEYSIGSDGTDGWVVRKSPKYFLLEQKAIAEEKWEHIGEHKQAYWNNLKHYVLYPIALLTIPLVLFLKSKHKRKA